MMKAYKFDEVLEIVESFSAEDQDALIEVLQRRRSEQRRTEIAVNITQAEEEYKQGKAKRVTVDELMAEFKE
ncbi:MAG TPA: hypothetical protein V6D13_07335 [Halomicronema sp.]